MGALITTPLTEYEIELGAKMVPRAGWNVPLAYPEGIIAEHRHTRTHCSVFDLCASGKLRVAGEGAAAALDGAWATVRAAKPCDAEGRLDGDPAYAAPAAGERRALLFGNEGYGLSRAALAACDRSVVIPMARGVDSLNVAASSAVAFWQLFR